MIFSTEIALSCSCSGWHLESLGQWSTTMFADFQFHKLNLVSPAAGRDNFVSQHQVGRIVVVLVVSKSFADLGRVSIVGSCRRVF